MSGNEIVILFFGVLAPSKGVSVLIDAFSKLKNLKLVKLVIAGYPSKHIDLKKIFDLIEGCSLADRIILDLRYIPNEEVPSIFKISDFVVYPYLSSTQSGSVQVAYSFGKPVVASRIGGLPEVVEDGKSGMLVEPNDPGDLAEKLDFMIDNADLRLRMGNYGKELSETKFSWDSIAA
ncbi:MAG: glycosyltransferase family 4 protein, partial [Anaerolineales bacterium]